MVVDDKGSLMDTESDLAELDRHIAEAIGWADVRKESDGTWVGRSPAMPLGQVRAVPPYSRDLESAWSVVLWMWQAHRLGVALGGHEGCWWADFSVADCALFGDETGATPAEAICRAALDAIADLGVR